VRAGGLNKRFDALIVPSISTRVLQDGFSQDQSAAEYVGGLGREGADALRAFVREGGTLLCLEDSCDYAIGTFDLPVVNVLKDLKSSAFYGPGSIVRLRYAVNSSPLVTGMPAEGSAYFDRSLAFEAKGDARIMARYAGPEVLQSGWLLGADKIRDKAALVEAPFGKGRVILFGFPPQHRGQPHATFRLLFNALLIERSGENERR